MTSFFHNGILNNFYQLWRPIAAQHLVFIKI